MINILGQFYALPQLINSNRTNGSSDDHYFDTCILFFYQVIMMNLLFDH